MKDEEIIAQFANLDYFINRVNVDKKNMTGT